MARFKASQSLHNMAQGIDEQENDATLLNTDEDDNSSEYRTGKVSEAELEVQRSVARKMGWVDKEEWTRDPTKWTDADQFLERTPQELTSLKDRLKRTGQAADAAIEIARQKAREEAEALVRKAAQDGDADLAVQAASKMAQHAGPDPRAVAWANRNTWFNTDPVANKLAVAIANQAAENGASVDEQLELVETEVRKRFPEHFGETKKENVEKRLSEVRTAPTVQSGTRGNSVKSKENGWNEIPSADRQMMGKQAKKIAASFKMDEKAAQERLAKAYWQNKGGN